VLNREGIEGATMVMINHGITTGALFLCVGLIYERLHTRELAAAAGVGRHMPVYTTFFGVFCLSSLAFPGTNSFIGEFLVLAGGFARSPWLTLAVVPGVVLAAAYLYRVLQRVAWGGTDNPEHAGLEDLGIREVILLLPLLAGVLWIGLNPQPVLDVMNASVSQLLEQAARSVPPAAAALSGS
jgi:NADH-quinone oxidoreductase subunit M